MPLRLSQKCLGIMAAFMLTALSHASTVGQPEGTSSALDRVLNVTSQKPDTEGIPDVRVQALQSLGSNQGERAGLADESKRIITDIETNRFNLSSKYNFGSLTFPTGALPPVIEDATDIISVMDYSMRVAGKIYIIRAPATFHMADWRDYLYLGLSVEDPVVNENLRSVYPRDNKETAYWQKVVREGYERGRNQAIAIFKYNLARLERDFYGMRTYYELYGRGLVSAPAIATATESVRRPDPNTIIIGETLIRITSPAAFEGDATKWNTTK
jgi:defect-in-organelle-trafficking protein DotC